VQRKGSDAQPAGRGPLRGRTTLTSLASLTATKINKAAGDAGFGFYVEFTQEKRGPESSRRAT
jgi:hypothetical protein